MVDGEIQDGVVFLLKTHSKNLNSILHKLEVAKQGAHKITAGASIRAA